MSQISQTTKLILGLAVVIVLFASGYAYYHAHEEIVAAGPASPEVTTLPSGSDLSNAALDTDIQAVDSQMTEVQKDNANTKASIQTAVVQ